MLLLTKRFIFPKKHIYLEYKHPELSLLNRSFSHITYGITGRLYVNNYQWHLLKCMFGDVRFVWNKFLEALQKLYKRMKFYCKIRNIQLYDKNHKFQRKMLKYIPNNLRFPKNFEILSKFLTEAKKHNKFFWLNFADSKALQVELQRLYNTYWRAFKHLSKAPNFKSKKCHYQSYTTNSASVLGHKFFIHNSNFKYGRLPVIGKIHIKLDGLFVGQIKRVTVILRPDGHLYVSLTTSCDKQMLPRTHKSIGIDVGRNYFLTLSDGQKIDFKSFMKYNQSNQKDWQSKSSRRRHHATKIINYNDKHPLHNRCHGKVRKIYYNQFRRYNYARKESARKFRHAHNQTYNYIQKITTWLVKHYDFIAIEDIHVLIMIHSKNRSIKMNNITQACWRMFRDLLAYKCQWYGKALIAVNPAYTSQICYHCLTWCGKHSVSERRWNCKNSHCYYNKHPLDRDICSAKLILMLAKHKVCPLVYRQIPKYKHSSLSTLGKFTHVKYLSRLALRPVPDNKNTTKLIAQIIKTYN